MSKFQTKSKLKELILAKISHIPKIWHIFLFFRWSKITVPMEKYKSSERILCKRKCTIFNSKNNFSNLKNQCTFEEITADQNHVYESCFLLLFILTSWSQKWLKNFVPFWSWSSKFVIKCTKCNANFALLDKLKLWFINQSIVFSLYWYGEIKKKL